MAQRQPPLADCLSSFLTMLSHSASSGSRQTGLPAPTSDFPIALVCDANILPTLRLFDCVDHFLRKRDHFHRNAELLGCKCCPSISVHHGGCGDVSEDQMRFNV